MLNTYLNFITISDKVTCIYFYRATIAGEANKKGGIYDRLSTPQNFSGIYKRRFESGDGRINDATTLSARTHDGSYRGNTNTRTDVISKLY